MKKIICLTDPPAVVDLKREFRKLDAREQELKPVRGGHIPPEDAAELEAVRARKAAIAREIFNVERSL